MRSKPWAPFLRFLDAGVGVRQIEVLERDLQRKAHIRAPRRADVGIRLAQAQIHRRFVVREYAAAFFGESGRSERRIRYACRGVAQQVVDAQLPGIRNAPQLVFGMPSAMHSRVEEARQFRLRGQAQRVVAELLQRRVDRAGGCRRPLQQALEARAEARQAGRTSQGANVVRLPQGEPDLQRDAVSVVQRGGDLERVAEGPGRRSAFRTSPARSETGRTAAAPWTKPRAVRVELQHDVAGQRDVSGSLLGWQRVDVQRRQAVPVAAGLEKHGVVQGADVAPLPEALLVLGAAPDANLFAAEVEAHQVEHAREGRSAGPVHSQHEYLHPLASSPLDLAHGTGAGWNVSATGGRRIDFKPPCRQA